MSRSRGEGGAWPVAKWHHYIYHQSPKNIYLRDADIQTEGIRMASGQPMGPPQQGPYPGYVPVYQPPHKPMIDHIKPIFSDALIALGLVLAIFLVWLGAVIAGWSNDPDFENAGNFLSSFGMLLLTIVLFVGGVVRSDMEIWVRVAMIIGAVLLISWVGFWPAEISIDWPV